MLDTIINYSSSIAIEECRDDLKALLHLFKYYLFIKRSDRDRPGRAHLAFSPKER